jgi:serine/threonine protein phosphatase PrpC
VDESLFLGYTTSLCDLNALDNFRFYFSKEIPKSIVLLSDGVVDSYNKENILKFSKTLHDLFLEDYDKAFADLADWLPKLSARGSRDDMSVAGVYSMSKPTDTSTP